MAKKYIECDIAAEIIKKLAFSQCSPFDKQEAIDGIESIPAADVEEVRHGVIQKVYRGGNPLWDEETVCSLCLHTVWDHFNYCANCGARMDGKEKNDDEL